MKEFTISANEANKTLYKFLKIVLPKAPDSLIYKNLRNKNIKYNDSKATGKEKLNVGDNIKIFFSDETFSKFQDSLNDSLTTDYERAYRILKNISLVYEDEDILVFNKGANVLTQKAKDSDLSLNEYLIGYLLSTGAVTENSLKTFHPSVLNRLDRNTRGLVICSKTLKASQIISELIKNRQLQKIYRATVKGRLSGELLLDDYLVKDEKTNKVTIYKEKPNLKAAFRIKTRIWSVKEDDDSTVINIDLITGKSHQIRAHLSSIGHPILGDTKYGDMAFNKKHNCFEQELTAFKLIFPKNIEIDSLKGRIIEI